MLQIIIYTYPNTTLYRHRMQWSMSKLKQSTLKYIYFVIFSCHSHIYVYCGCHCDISVYTLYYTVYKFSFSIHWRHVTVSPRHLKAAPRFDYFVLNLNVNLECHLQKKWKKFSFCQRTIKDVRTLYAVHKLLFIHKNVHIAWRKCYVIEA